MNSTPTVPRWTVASGFHNVSFCELVTYIAAKQGCRDALADAVGIGVQAGLPTR